MFKKRKKVNKKKKTNKQKKVPVLLRFEPIAPRCKKDTHSTVLHWQLYMSWRKCWLNRFVWERWVVKTAGSSTFLARTDKSCESITKLLEKGRKKRKKERNHNNLGYYPINQESRRIGLNFVDLTKHRSVLMVWRFHAEHRSLFLRSFKGYITKKKTSKTTPGIETSDPT